MSSRSYAELIGLDALGRFKRLAGAEAAYTANVAMRLGVTEVRESRGQSAYVLEMPDRYLAIVDEGLGTKNLVADDLAIKTLLAQSMTHLAHRSFYDQIAQDTIAMIVNDLITCGARPLAVMMHLAVGHSDWFNDEVRYADLLRGWRNACMLAGCNWGGGETPVLRDIIYPDRCVIAGSAMGMVDPKTNYICGDVEPGDAIVFLLSSGIHANGLTYARELAKTLPQGYLTPLPDGRTYAETLLDPTIIYARFLENCQKAGVKIKYAVNITGHGWRKLMRLPRSFTYVIEHMPPALPIFEFMQQHGMKSNREMIETFNCGAGFALYVPESDVLKVLGLSKTSYPKVVAMHAGHVEKSTETQLIVPPLNERFIGSELNIG